MKEADWDRLIRQIRRGDCIPLLGAGASTGRLPTGRQLSSYFATRYNYPFTDRENLSHVMQYVALHHEDAIDLKVEVCDYLKQCALPASDPLDPHTVLAEFPITTFITTNYDNFMYQALQSCRAGSKSPSMSTSHWWDAKVPAPPVEYSTADRPLVHHLHGNWDDPASLVITEDDYVTYLLNLRGVQDSDQLPIPLPVLEAMVSKPVLFVGYSLQDLNFRVLFRGLIGSMPTIRRRRHISVQLLPELDVSLANAGGLANDYLMQYYDDLEISIYVGDTAEFFKELLDRDARTPWS